MGYNYAANILFLKAGYSANIQNKFQAISFIINTKIMKHDMF